MAVLDFYKNKRVFITGHTGFKGTWLCEVLLKAGAQVTGYALEPPTSPSLFALTGMERRITSYTGDIRDFDKLFQVFCSVQPEVVFHLAAQPLVRESYRQPVKTFETNILGTVNILECIRLYPCTKSFINITTDKVYENKEWTWGYREIDMLGGEEPYSCSKACSELVTQSYQRSFFKDGIPAISTARAGNVIGGGDFAIDRILPDCVRAAQAGKAVYVRNPDAIRPYQHVLEPLLMYLEIAMRQYEDSKYAGSYNIGPDEKDCLSTKQLVECFCKAWGNGQTWEVQPDYRFHESNYLRLDCSKIWLHFGRRPKWSTQTAVEKVVEWSKAYLNHEDILPVMHRQIEDFLA